MKRLLAMLAVVALVVTAGALLFAAQPKTYQVTGPVLEVRDDAIVVQKGNDKWEVGRDAGTKVTGDLKVGAKVTIEYRMVATTVAVKEAGTAAAKKGKKTTGD